MSFRMIVKAALLLFKGEGDGRQMMFVRAKDKSYFVFPGGKQEPGETIEHALERELQEELQVGVKNPKSIGIITGATPDGRTLEEHLFVGELTGTPKVAAEIKEAVWMTRAEALNRKEELTPISLGKIFPFLEQKGLW